MSYTRSTESGHYIWSDGEYLTIDDKIVDEEAIDVFIYKLYVGNDKEEFWDRYKHGKDLVYKFLEERIREEDCKYKDMAKRQLEVLKELDEKNCS